jgi:hypothetical protein
MVVAASGEEFEKRKNARSAFNVVYDGTGAP